MNEFDLRSFLYNNPLLESEAKLKAAKEKLEKQEAKLDKVDMKDEDAKEKAVHHKKAIKNVSKEIKDLEKDLAFDKKAEAKEEKEAKAEAKAKKKEKSVKEGMGKSYYEDGDMKEEMEDKKLTKEGLKDMIREKITSILNEDAELYEAEEDNVDVDVEKDVDIDVKDEVDIDDESSKSEIEVDSELAGESSDISAILGLLTKAQDEAKSLGDEKLMDQIGNTITFFTRKHVVQSAD